MSFRGGEYGLGNSVTRAKSYKRCSSLKTIMMNLHDENLSKFINSQCNGLSLK